METLYLFYFDFKIKDFLITGGEFRCRANNQTEAQQVLIEYLKERWQYDENKHHLSIKIDGLGQKSIDSLPGEGAKTLNPTGLSNFLPLVGLSA